MKLKTLLLSLFCISTLFSGEVQFDLSEYEPIEYRVVGLDFVPYISSFLSDSSKQSSANIILPISVHKKRNHREQYFDLNSPINNNENPTNLFDNNNRKGVFSFQHFNISSHGQNNFTFMLSPSVSYAHKRFMRPEKFFLSLQTRGEFTKLILLNNSTDRDVYNDKEITLFLELALGGGKVKNVTYPAVCMQAFDYLSQQRLLQDYSKGSFHKVAQTFERLQIKRFFDSRKKRIRDIKVITSELYRDSISLQLNPEQLMNILDYWEYGFNQPRYHGRELAFKVKIFADEPYFDDTPYRDSENLLSEEDSTGSSTFLRFQTHRSPNLKIYRSIIAEIGSKTTEYYEKAYVSLQPQLFIYPNFRSTINFTNLFVFSEYLEYPERREIVNSLSSSYQYYISSQMSIIGEWILNINTELGQSVTNSISAGLIYHIR